MKRLLTILLMSLTLFSTSLFADEQGDEYDDGYVYTQNGKGDRMFKFGLQGFAPLNFGKQLYFGGAVNLGFYQFLNSWLAIGGETNFSYNVSIGNKILITAPITFGVIAQPTAGKLEFPLSAGVGIGYETWQSMQYFPSFVGRVNAGVYYRFNEAFSLGSEATFFWIPQWVADPRQNYNGLFLSVSIGARYHF